VKQGFSLRNRGGPAPILQAREPSGSGGRHAVAEIMPNTAISGISASATDMMFFNMVSLLWMSACGEA
jgi:hypothetical protein